MLRTQTGLDYCIQLEEKVVEETKIAEAPSWRTQPTPDINAQVVEETKIAEAPKRGNIESADQKTQPMPDFKAQEQAMEVYATIQQLDDAERAKLQANIIPFPDLFANLQDNKPEISRLVEQAEPGLKEALQATLETLTALFEYSAPGWDELKQRSEVSFVKATKSTNTSVTAGVAMRLLQPGQSIGILNCGTGPVKLQFYKKDRSNVVRVLADVKPDTVSLSSLSVSPFYQPKEGPAVAPETIVEHLKRELAPLQAKFQTRVVAIVTGKIRLAWELCKAERVIFEKSVAEIFLALGVEKWDGNSYFVTQDEEGFLESNSTTNLLRDISPSYDVMFTLGIGKGTCQWATPKRTVKHAFGMLDPTKLVGGTPSLKVAVLNALKDPEYLAELLQLTANLDRPVIALKSGCLIWLVKSVPLLELLLRARVSKRELTRPLFGSGQTLRILLKQFVKEVRVRSYDPSTCLHELDLMPSTAQLHVDLSTALFEAQAPKTFDPLLAKWNSLSDLRVMGVRALHQAKGLPCGWFIESSTIPSSSILFAKKDLDELKKSSGKFSDLSGKVVGTLEWDKKFGVKIDSDRQLLSTDVNYILNGKEFSFDSTSCSVICLTIGTRIVADLGCFTLVGIEDGRYVWKVDNSTAVHDKQPGSKIVRAATPFSYVQGANLIVLGETTDSKHSEEQWIPVTVVGRTAFNTHTLQCLDGSTMLLDLNDFNHTWREVWVDEAGGYAACMARYKAHIEAQFRHVEDAITGRKLVVRDQLLHLQMRAGHKAEIQTQIVDVQSLVTHLLSREQRQSRHKGMFKPLPVLIMAAPGSGKTWTIWQLMYLLAVENSGCPERVCLSPVVIFVQILAGLIRKYDRELHQCRVGFVEFYLRKTCEKRVDRQFLLQAYRMRTLIIAVDGIDEAGDLRDSIVELVMDQLVDGGHACVVTSRPEGVQHQGSFVNPHFSEFAVLDLAPLTVEQQDRAIQTQLKDNDFYNHLRQFSEVRLRQDQLYESFPLEHRRKIEAFAVPDLFFAAMGQLDPRMRQWNTCGTLIQTGSQINSRYFARPPDQLLLDKLADKLSVPHSQLWAQIVADCDELYQVAELALPHIKKGIEQILEELKIPLEQLSFASLKNPIRVYEKARDDYADRFKDQVPATACVCDVVRGRVLCDEMSELGMILEALVDRPPPWLRVIRMKNKFKDVDATRFRNIHFNLLAVCCGSCGAVAVISCACGKWSPTQHLFEIQLLHRRIFELNEAMHAHDHYDFFRAITSIKVGEQLDFVINKQVELFSEISSSPVLLSLLILVLGREDHQLPTSLFELYELALEAAIQTFLNLRSQSDEGLREEVLGVVRQIAFDNHIAERRTFGHLASNHPKFAIWNEICATGKNDTTVLSFVKVISQMELYQFSHLSFQEFFFLEGASSRRHSGLSLAKLIKKPFYENAMRIGVTNQAINHYLVPGPSLELKPDTLSEAQANIVSDMLRVNTTLTKLDLPSNNITQLKHLDSNSTLTTLCLPDNKLGRLGVRSLAVALANHRSLVYLDLTSNGINGSQAVALGEALSHNTVLKTLVLAKNGFEVTVFARACLPTNTTLTSLDLSGNIFQEVDEFCAALRANRGLKALYLNSTCRWSSKHSNLILAIDFGRALAIGLNNDITPEDAVELGRELAALPSPHSVVRRILISHWIDLETFQGEPQSLSLETLADNDLAFVSAFLKPSLRKLELSSTSVGLRYILDGCGLTLTDLKVHVRGLHTLKPLLPFLILRNSHTRQLTVQMVQKDQYSSSTSFSDMDRCGGLCMLSAVMSLAAINSIPEYNQLPAIIIRFLLKSVFGLPIWQVFAGYALVSKYWDFGLIFAVCSLVFNGWLIWLPMCVSCGLIPFVWVWIYAALLLLVLLCNSSNFKLDVWMPARYYVDSDVTCANIMSVIGLCVTTVQLSIMIFSSLFDLSNSLAFQLLMLHSPDASVNWAVHGILAGLVLGVGAEVLQPIGESDYLEGDHFDKGLMHFLKAVYQSSFILPFIYVPMFFNLLIGLKSELQDDVIAGFAVVLAGFVAFSLCTSWARIQLDYSGKQVLTSETWFVNLEYSVVFVFVFLAHALSAYPEYFFWIALGLMLLELGVIWKFRPFARTRGNILKASSSLVLCIVAACAIAVSKGASAEWVLGVGFGLVALIVVLVCIVLPRVKHRVTSVTHSGSNSGSNVFGMLNLIDEDDPFFLPIAYFVEFLLILLVPIWASQDCSGLQTWAIISDVLLVCGIFVVPLILRYVNWTMSSCSLAFCVDFGLGVWQLASHTGCSPSLFVSSILLVILLPICAMCLGVMVFMAHTLRNMDDD